MPKILALITAFVVCLAAAGMIGHSWYGAHAGVDMSGYVSVERHEALVSRLDSLDAIQGDMAGLRKTLEGLVEKANFLQASAENRVTEIDSLRDQIEDFAIILTEAQNDDGMPERLARRVFVLERQSQAVSGRANHAHCLAHRALGEPCR